MKRRGYLSVLISVCMMLGLYYFYSHTDVIKGQKKIGATYMTMNNSFYVALNEEVEKSVNIHKDLLYTYNPCLDEQKQCEQIDQLVDKGIDALIINPVTSDSEVLLDKLREVKKKGIKIVVVDSSLSDDTISDCTIISNNYGAGSRCGRDLMARMKKAKILLVEHKEALSAVDRINGFLTTLKGKDYEVVARIDSHGSTTQAMPLVQEVIDQNIGFDVVMAVNDPSALGALAAIESRHLERNISVYSVDGSPDMKKLISTSNNYIATCAQTPIKMGQTTIDTVYALIDGIEADQEIVMPVDLVTKDNINDYNISGWQ